MEARSTDRCDGLRAGIRNLPVALDACRPCLVEGRSLPEERLFTGNIFGCAHSRTVNNLIKVDFPAPLGPMMPTRLKEEMKSFAVDRATVAEMNYLERDNAQLTL